MELIDQLEQAGVVTVLVASLGNTNIEPPQRSESFVQYRGSGKFLFNPSGSPDWSDFDGNTSDARSRSFIVPSSSATFGMAVLSSEYSFVAIKPRKNVLEQELLLILNGAEDIFIDGEPSEFLDNFVNFIERYQVPGVNAFGRLLVRESLRENLVARSLRWLGRVSDESSRDRRRQLLEEFLLSDKMQIRDGALLGLVSLGDSRSVPAIQTALEKERGAVLKRSMEAAIKRLLPS